MISANALTVWRGGRTILDNVALEARAGDFIAVIGANGAGKSTLLSVLAGLLKPDAGTVTIGGRAITDFRGQELARRRAYLPQNPRVEWPISVERLVALGLTPALPAFGPLPMDMGSRVARALEECDLAGRRAQAATTLSGGELARAMLARAMVGEPDILIVDEPIAGLDPRHALETARRLQSLAHAGKLVIAALHDLTLAGRHANRVLALAAGRVAGDGPTGTILTPGLIRDVFEVEARVSGEGTVDFRAPA